MSTSATIHPHEIFSKPLSLRSAISSPIYILLSSAVVPAWYFGQLWLFTVAILSIALVDTQIAWRAQHTRLVSVEKFILELPPLQESASKESVPVDIDVTAPMQRKRSCRPKSGRPTTKDGLDTGHAFVKHHVTPVTEYGHTTVELEESKEAHAVSIVDGQSEKPHVTIDDVPCSQASPEHALTEQIVQEVNKDANRVLEALDEKNSVHAVLPNLDGHESVAPPVVESLRAAQDEYQDDTTTDIQPGGDEAAWKYSLQSEMESIKLELEQALSARRLRMCGDSIMSSPSMNMPPTPPLDEKAPGYGYGPIRGLGSSSRGSTDGGRGGEEEELGIISMEELESHTACSSSGSDSFGDFVEAEPVTGQSLCGLTSNANPGFVKDTPHFPNIQDVLSAYEATKLILDEPSTAAISECAGAEGPQDASNQNSADDESRNGLSDTWDEEDDDRIISGMNSPATSISTTNEEVEFHKLDLNTPQANVHVKISTVEIPQTRTTGPAETVSRPAYLRASSSSSYSWSSRPKHAPRKNNGWKRVPKKQRLTAAAKKRFLSRAVW